MHGATFEEVMLRGAQIKGHLTFPRKAVHCESEFSGTKTKEDSA